MIWGVCRGWEDTGQQAEGMVSLEFLHRGDSLAESLGEAPGSLGRPGGGWV